MRPCYTMPGVKAFSKTLRSRLNEQDHLDQLPVDLVDKLMHPSQVGFPTRNSFIKNMSELTCIVGKPGTGKTTLAVLAAMSMSSLSRQYLRVLYLTSEQPGESGSPLAALVASGFREVNRENLSEKIEQVLDYDRSNLILYKSNLSDLNTILQHEIYDMLIVVDELFLRGGLPGTREPWPQNPKGYLETILRISQHKLGTRVIINEHIFLEHDEFPDLVKNYKGRTGQLLAWLLLEIGQSPTMINHYNDDVREFGFPCIGSGIQRERTNPDRLFPDKILEFINERVSYGTKIETRVREFLQSAPVMITSHSHALEVTSRLLGYSSWHALQGCLKKMDRHEGRSVKDR